MFIFRKSFRGQIIASLIPIITFVMLITMMAFYTVSSNIIQAQTEEHMLGGLSNAVSYLDDMLETSKQELIRFANDGDIIENIQNISAADTYSYLLSSQTIRQRISEVDILTEHIENVYIYSFLSERFFQTDQPRTLTYDDVYDTRWYGISNTDSINNWVFYRDDLAGGNQYVLMQSTPIQDSSRNNIVGVVSMSIGINTLRATLNTSRITANSDYYITNSDGQIIYHYDINQIGKMIDEAAIEALNSENGTAVTDESFIAVIKSDASEGWNYFVESDADDIFEPLYLLQQVTILFIVLAIIVLFAIITSVSHKIVQPIHLLKNYMKQAKAKNYKEQICTKREDEFGELYSSYNELIEQTDRLINDNYAQKLLITQLQVKNLQVQIAPHFLYNALDAIHWAIRENSADEACDMIFYLADHFRKGLTDGRDIIPIYECAEILESYLQLQRVLFENSIKITTYVNPIIEKMPVLKYLFQPIVENAFKHGLSQKEGDRQIHIAFECVNNGKLRFSVSDNGVGISKQRLQEIKQSLKHINSSDMQEHLALKNISLQLKTLYDDASLIIESVEGEGTTVSFEIEP